MLRIRSGVFAFLAVISTALPLAADLSGISAAQINLPVKMYDLAVGPDGNLWGVTAKGTLGRYTAAGAYTEVVLPWSVDQNNIPYAQSLKGGSDGNLWVIGSNGHVARVSPSGGVSDFTAASGAILTSPPAAGADGAIWFYNRLAAGPGTIGSPIWKMTRVDMYGQVTTYDLGISGDNLTGLVSGGDGSLWFLDATTNQVVRFSLLTNSTAGKYVIPTKLSGANRMILAWDGNVWFTNGSKIDRVTVDGNVSEFAVPSGASTAAIMMGGDNAIWFSEPDSGRLGQIDLASVSGSSANVTESSAIHTGLYDLFVLPPAFATPAPSALDTSQFDCTPKVEVGWDSLLGIPMKFTVPTAAPCYNDLRATMAMTTFNDGNKTVQETDMIAFLSLACPPPVGSKSLRGEPLAVSGTINAVATFAAPAGMAITSIDTSDSSGTATFSGLTATITKGPMGPNDSFVAMVHFSRPTTTAPVVVSGALVARSDINDANPQHHTAVAFAVLSSLGGRTTLPPNSSNPVTTPVTRGK